MSDFAYPLHEECGVFGIYDRAGTEDVLQRLIRRCMRCSTAGRRAAVLPSTMTA